MLILPIKKKWFDMILSGEKKEEYREIKPYYTSRFRSIFFGHYSYLDELFLEGLKNGNRYNFSICFCNGYSKTSSSFVANCILSFDTGKEEWGAEKGKEYFVLTIHEILKGSD